MLEDSGDEEETNGIVSRVLDEIGIEMSGKVHFESKYHHQRYIYHLHIAVHRLPFLQPHIFFFFVFQMANAPTAISDSIGASTNKMTEKDIEAQLAKLRSS